MGDAIARLRQAALDARHWFDFEFYSPIAATEENRSYFEDMLRVLAESADAGVMPAEQYAAELECIQADIEGECVEVEQDSKQPALHGPSPYQGPRPRPDDMRALASEAVASALAWGHLSASIEGHIIRLLDVHEKVHLGMLARKQAVFDAEDALGLTPGDPKNLSPCVMPDLLDELADDDEKRQTEYAAALKDWFSVFLALHPFIKEPPAPAATSEKKPGEKQKKRRDRKGIGGTPENFPKTFYREVVAARERHEKQAAKGREPLLSISEWLSDYFTKVKNLPLSTLPSKDPQKP